LCWAVGTPPSDIGLASADDSRLTGLAHQGDATRRLMPLEGVGAVTATAIVATIGDGKVFKNGRQFAAWLGLVPRRYASGGESRLGRIGNRGDVDPRTVLIHGVRSVLRLTGQRTDAKSRWAERRKHRRRSNVANVDWHRNQYFVKESLYKGRFVEPKSASSIRAINLPQTLLEELRTHKAQQSEKRLQVGEGVP
jgi:hypothetical protein